MVSDTASLLELSAQQDTLVQFGTSYLLMVLPEVKQDIQASFVLFFLARSKHHSSCGLVPVFKIFGSIIEKCVQKYMFIFCHIALPCLSGFGTVLNGAAHWRQGSPLYIHPLQAKCHSLKF